MKTKKFRHLYDYYPLYELTFSESLVAKHNEAFAAVRMTERWLEQTRGKVPGPHDKGLNVLEILAGGGEHREFYLRHATFNVSDYYELEFVDQLHLPSHVIVGDATSLDYSSKEIDLVMGLYLSANSLLDTDMCASRKVMENLLENTYKNLADSGALLLARFDDPVKDALYQVEGRNNEPDYAFVPYGHQLRADFGIPSHSGFVQIRMYTEVSYDRRVAITTNKILRTEILLDGTVVGTIAIEKPFQLRFWSEHALSELALDVGFKDLMYYRADEGTDPDNDILLDAVTKNTHDYKLDDLLSTHILMLK